MKRFFDLLISFVLLIILIMPIAVISLAILFTSKGPIIHWSKRIGKDNIIFMMPKFRTMTTNTPDVATHLLQDPSTYYTPVGKFLRNYSIDELPQLYSILIGDMSLVGPRPALHNQDDLVFLRTEVGVHSLLPGITGLAQINGRDNLSIQEKVEFDLNYLKEKSFRFDIYIIWLTALKVLKRKPFILDRADAYLGVMIDDLITRGAPEPYRMFTSRAEYRLRLRIDNADQRLTELGYKIGVVSKKRWSLYSQKKNKLNEAYKVLTDLSLTPDEGIKKGLNIRKDGVRRTASELLSFPDISFKEISGIWPKLLEIEPKIALQLEIECQYAIYIERQKNDIETYRKDSKLKIPKNIDYSSVGSLSNEAKEVLKKAKPETIAQASSLPGITPAAIGAVIIHMRQLAA